MPLREGHPQHLQPPDSNVRPVTLAMWLVGIPGPHPMTQVHGGDAGLRQPPSPRPRREAAERGHTEAKVTEAPARLFSFITVSHNWDVDRLAIFVPWDPSNAMRLRWPKRPSCC